MRRPLSVGSGPGSLGRIGRGHTLVEVIIVLALLPLLLAAGYGALAAAHRFYLHQTQRMKVRESALTAIEVLAAEFRALSPAAGDIYAMAPDSVALRSTVGSGFVCRALGASVSLWRVSGIIGGSVADSALIFAEGTSPFHDDDTVLTARIVAATPGGDPVCPGGAASQRELIVDPPIEGVTTGAAVRAFRPYVYRLYRGSDGRWWFGQRPRGGIIQPIAGPFAPPAEGGLELRWLTAAGVAATRTDEVARVDIRVGSRARRRVGGGAPFVVDSLRAIVAVRNR